MTQENLGDCDAEKARVPRYGRLRKHLIVIIAVKVAALTIIWWCFFRAELRPPADDAAVAEQIFSSRRASE